MAADELSKCDTNVRLDGKVAIVTGSTSGTGYETAKNLANRGAKVILASRNPNKLSEAKRRIIQDTGNPNIDTRRIDVASLTSVRNFVQETIYLEPQLDILINNVGAIGLPDVMTEDNLHMMMQVNYFGSFLLTFLLYPLLRRSAPSRIVNVSSLALLLGTIDLKLMNDVGRYSNFGFYCNAKLADVMFTVEMDKRIQGSGVAVYSLDPGLGKSDFFRNFNESLVKSILSRGLITFGRPLKSVAKMPVFLAVDSKVANSSGKHFRDCEEFYSNWFAYDSQMTARLWIKSKELVGIRPEEDWELYNRYR